MSKFKDIDIEHRDFLGTIIEKNSVVATMVSTRWSQEFMLYRVVYFNAKSIRLRKLLAKTDRSDTTRDPRGCIVVDPEMVTAYLLMNTKG